MEINSKPYIPNKKMLTADETLLRSYFCDEMTMELETQRRKQQLKSKTDDGIFFEEELKLCSVSLLPILSPRKKSPPQ